MEMLLSDSTFCRLCAEENSNGVVLYQEGEGEENCSDLVNRYLPFKVSDDGKLPRTICPGCHIQLQATAQFFELLVEGQKKLREMWKTQLEVQRKERHAQPAPGPSQTGESLLLPAAEIETNGLNDENSSIITIQILPDGALYTDSHPISLKIDGLDKPRRKRGRPPKVHPPEVEPAEPVEATPEEQVEDEEEPEGDGRRRRKRKLPQRFMEAVAGKELERIFREEGVIDEEDAAEEGDADEDKEDRDGGLYIRSPLPGSMEVIGHLETDEGADLGEVTVMNKSRARLMKRRKTKFSCEICGKGFQHRGRYILHKNGHKGVKFECNECNEVFSNRETLLEHQTQSGHTGEGIIEGVVGGADGVEDGAEDTGERIPCLRCDKSFQSKQSFEVHIKAIHEKQRPFTCNVCGKTFAYQNTLNFHMASHKSSKAEREKGFPCDICGKVLNHPSSVVYHKEAEHNNGRRFVCNKCGKSFKHKQLLQRHQLVHSEDRPYTCKLCGATFKTNANLMNHQPTHTGEKKYFCEMCGQQFAHKTSLTLHYRWHTGQKPFACVHCHKSFSQNGNLQEHLRIHTGEKPFCCETCGRKFTTSSQFKLHVKRHTGERPWKCEFCNKAFLHKDTWKCHTRRHKGERPFMCEYCKRGFTEQWALRKHMRLHTGEKPYSCNICGKNFSDCSNLTKHRRVHRNDPKNNTDIDPNVWNLIQAQIAKEEGSDVEHAVDMEHAVEMMASATDGRRKVIYVTYQDPNDPTHSQTLQIVDDIMPEDEMEGQDELKAMGMDCELGEPASPGDGQAIGIDPSVNIDPQSLQVTDEDGNPIHFTMQDGRELQVSINTTDGQSLQVTTLDGQTIPLRLINNDGQVQPMVDRSMMAIDDEVDDSLAGGEHSIEYTTEDGQKVRLVTSYDVGQITSDFLDQA